MATPETTRTDHLARAKARALARLETCSPSTLAIAWAVFDEALAAHPDTADHKGRDAGFRLLLAGQLGTKAQMRAFITGLN